MPEKLYILGHPVTHSKSPAMHEAAYRALGLDWEYGFKDCETEIAARVFLNVRQWRALNVTMPWKPLAYEAADIRSAAAVLAGGANVLVNWGGRVHADNTDGKGCVEYLRRCGVLFEGARVVVCGTGPTSLAIMHACSSAGACRVALLGRDAAKAQRVLDGYRVRVADDACSQGQEGECGETAVLVADSYEGAREELAHATVIVDATPLGMGEGDPAPFDTATLSPGQVVLDVVYGHGESSLVAAAHDAGCAAFDGAGMLVAQAVETVRDIAAITGIFSIPAHMDLFAIMADAAGFDL